MTRFTREHYARKRDEHAKTAETALKQALDTTEPTHITAFATEATAAATLALYYGSRVRDLTPPSLDGLDGL